MFDLKKIAIYRKKKNIAPLFRLLSRNFGSFVAPERWIFKYTWRYTGKHFEIIDHTLGRFQFTYIYIFAFTPTLCSTQWLQVNTPYLTSFVRFNSMKADFAVPHSDNSVKIAPLFWLASLSSAWDECCLFEATPCPWCHLTWRRYYILTCRSSILARRNAAVCERWPFM